MPIKTDREYRIAMPLSAVGAENRVFDTDYYVEGYATTFDTPYLLYEWGDQKYYEVVDRHALDGADMSDVIMQFDHSGTVFSRKSNKTLFIEPRDAGLFIAADLSKSAAAQNMYQEIKSGLVTRMSWSFRVTEDSYDRDARTRRILKVKKVYDVSAVSIPANDGTSINARGAEEIGESFRGIIEAEESRLRDLAKARIELKIKLTGVGTSE